VGSQRLAASAMARPKLHLGKSEGQIKFGKCLPNCSSEIPVFSSAVYKRKDYNVSSSSTFVD
jgi:hypothetical protein